MQLDQEPRRALAIVSNTFLCYKKPGLPTEMADFRSRAGTVPNETAGSFPTRKQRSCQTIVKSNLKRQNTEQFCIKHLQRTEIIKHH